MGDSKQLMDQLAAAKKALEMANTERDAAKKEVGAAKAKATADATSLNQKWESKILELQNEQKARIAELEQRHADTLDAHAKALLNKDDTLVTATQRHPETLVKVKAETSQHHDSRVNNLKDILIHDENGMLSKLFIHIHR